MQVRIKRVYEEPDAHDGLRVLVDRLWPRGLSKSQAKVDLWLREIAPSTELRKWFGHDPAKWTEFQRRYCAELHRNSEQVRLLRQELHKGPVTCSSAQKTFTITRLSFSRKFSNSRSGQPASSQQNRRADGVISRSRLPNCFQFILIIR